MVAEKKIKVNEQASKVENMLIDMGGRCIRHEKASDKRFALDFWICNGRLVILQIHKDGGVEVFRAINEKNQMDDLVRDLKEYINTGYNDPTFTK